MITSHENREYRAKSAVKPKFKLKTLCLNEQVFKLTLKKIKNKKNVLQFMAHNNGSQWM